ncbi:hypothetical protein D3C85_1523870 [compost metagenome]
MIVEGCAGKGGHFLTDIKATGCPILDAKCRSVNDIKTRITRHSAENRSEVSAPDLDKILTQREQRTHANFQLPRQSRKGKLKRVALGTAIRELKD